MSIQDPLGDMLTRIRNAQERGKSKVICPVSKLRGRVLEVLKQEGYIRDFATVQMGAAKAEFEIELKYFDGAPGDPARSIVSRSRAAGIRLGGHVADRLQWPRHLDPFNAQRASCPTTRQGRRTWVAK